jgi:hypothetical protein
MATRNIRVTKWIGTVPAVGVCTSCAKTFKVPLDLLKRTAEAQESLRKQFAEHKCKPPDSQKALRDIHEAANDK